LSKYSNYLIRETPSNYVDLHSFGNNSSAAILIKAMELKSQNDPSDELLLRADPK
jgi:hypothetical protein